VDVILVVGDQDALSLALEKACLAHDALRSQHGERFLSTKLELRRDVRVVDDIGHLVARSKFEDVDRADVPAVGAARALREIDVDLDHLDAAAKSERKGLLAFEPEFARPAVTFRP
jgi:hypothetical protein